MSKFRVIRLGKIGFPVINGDKKGGDGWRLGHFSQSGMRWPVVCLTRDAKLTAAGERQMAPSVHGCGLYRCFRKAFGKQVTATSLQEIGLASGTAPRLFWSSEIFKTRTALTHSRRGAVKNAPTSRSSVSRAIEVEDKASTRSTLLLANSSRRGSTFLTRTLSASG